MKGMGYRLSPAMHGASLLTYWTNGPIRRFQEAEIHIQGGVEPVYLEDAPL